MKREDEDRGVFLVGLFDDEPLEGSVYAGQAKLWTLAHWWMSPGTLSPPTRSDQMLCWGEAKSPSPRVAPL